jgi:amidophosphoribosyltransferase
MPDAFQPVYFGNSASRYHGEEIFRLRMGLGQALTKLYASEADVVIPNPDSGRGVSYGIAEGLRKPLYPGLVKQAQAIRTFQEAGRSQRMRQVAVKFAAMDSVLAGRAIIMGDDSIVKGSVSEGGAVWSVYNAGATRLEFWVSYGPMFFPSFKEWRRGRECLDELAVQRAFRGDNPYDKTAEEINARVAKLLGVERVCYNTVEQVQAVIGPGCYQALDAAYPISEPFWPDWLKQEVEHFRHYR